MQPRDRAAAEGVLLTDMYQLTMAQLYFHEGLHERTALFEYFFRSYPDYGEHQAGYCVSAGLEWLFDWMSEVRFSSDDLDFLRQQQGRSGRGTFDEDFLAWLDRSQTFEPLIVEAIPEGRLVHPNEPIVVVRGPLALAQLLETALLNHLNYQTLIATKASRVSESARGQPVLEFGLRRAPDRGGSAGARAALIGGADFTSNVGMSRALGLSPKGTHAHSMVQVFMALGMEELGAFRAYAETFPDDCLLLVDTIDTLGSGVPNAIQVFEELRARGHEPIGIRLDSGDLAYLAIQAAVMLDEAGFDRTTIVLSNQLEELSIWQILAQIEDEAPRYDVDAQQLVRRLSFGVGSRLITSQGAGYLDGVYKVVAVQDHGEWIPAIKVSENPEKVTTPGYKQVWRVYDRRGRATADVLALRNEDLSELSPMILHHPVDYTVSRVLPAEEMSASEPLLETVFEGGKRTGPEPSLDELRRRRNEDLERLDPGVRRLVNPHVYHVSLTQHLWDLKRDLTDEARRSMGRPPLGS
jgi:nicotinate phosphoribosyltransferase